MSTALTWTDVLGIANGLPEVEESTSWGRPSCKVCDKAFVTLRPLSKRDQADLAGRVPSGEFVLVLVGGELEKQAIIEAEAACFSIPHLDGYPGLLVRLDVVEHDLLEDLIVESWFHAAPPKLATEYEAQLASPGGK